MRLVEVLGEPCQVQLKVGGGAVNEQLKQRVRRASTLSLRQPSSRSRRAQKLCEYLDHKK